MRSPLRTLKVAWLLTTAGCGGHVCDWEMANEAAHVQPVLLTDAPAETVSSCLLSIAHAAPQVRVRADVQEGALADEGQRFVLWMANEFDLAHPNAGVTRVHEVDGRPALYLQDMIITVTSDEDLDRRIISFVEQPMSVLVGYHMRRRHRVASAYSGLPPTGELTRQVRDYVSACVAGRAAEIDLSQGVAASVERLQRCR